MIILIIDPGITVMEFDLIKVIRKQAKLIMINEIFLRKYASHSLKFKKYSKRRPSLIDIYQPNEC
ncbi:MAG: hypothetical protein ACMUEL_01855 [Flavobacteriales bacterium Tduv]